MSGDLLPAQSMSPRFKYLPFARRQVPTRILGHPTRIADRVADYQLRPD